MQHNQAQATSLAESNSKNSPLGNQQLPAPPTSLEPFPETIAASMQLSDDTHAGLEGGATQAKKKRSRQPALNGSASQERNHREATHEQARQDSKDH